jgi:hypothetical protein
MLEVVVAVLVKETYPQMVVALAEQVVEVLVVAQQQRLLAQLLELPI